MNGKQATGVADNVVRETISLLAIVAKAGVYEVGFDLPPTTSGPGVDVPPPGPASLATLDSMLLGYRAATPPRRLVPVQPGGAGAGSRTR